MIRVWRDYSVVLNIFENLAKAGLHPGPIQNLWGLSILNLFTVIQMHGGLENQPKSILGDMGLREWFEELTPFQGALYSAVGTKACLWPLIGPEKINREDQSKRQVFWP